METNGRVNNLAQMGGQLCQYRHLWKQWIKLLQACLIQSQKTNAYRVTDFATLSDERMSHSKIVLLLQIKEPFIQKFEVFTCLKILGILQTELNSQSFILPLSSINFFST